jgi:Cupredoxin-like domain
MKHLIMTLALCTALTHPCLADETTSLALVLREHRFVPERLQAPAGVKIEITVKNEDNTADEFDSRDLKREKVIGGSKSGLILVGPLPPGEYHFQGEYHAKTAQGILEIRQ